MTAESRFTADEVRALAFVAEQFPNATFLRDGRLVGEVIDAEVRLHAVALARRAPDPWPCLSDDDLEQVHARLDVLSDERAARRREHEHRLAAEARRLGREVAEYRVTLADAEARLERLMGEMDGSVFLVPWSTASEIVRCCFAEGMRRG